LIQEKPGQVEPRYLELSAIALPDAAKVRRTSQHR
jgi:hypothetical protein